MPSPPRTRGSTHHGRLLPHIIPVSPAYAGIDPRASCVGTNADGLPRVRGDRPGLPTWFGGLTASPPRTRGSTCEYYLAVTHRYVSPAYAGIDPREPRRHGLLRRLPRVRVDRPAHDAERGRACVSPPRTRGSTCPLIFARFHAVVSPAYAGIDPLLPRRNLPGVRLPRVRGDRPCSKKLGVRMRRSPPRTRGSTRGIPLRQVRHQVSPAYAGIDPARMGPPLSRIRLPRVRGDRPWWARVKQGHTRSPPRTRGSTRSRTGPGCRSEVSPAYAGIDPWRRPPPGARASLPRVRGDRPYPVNAEPRVARSPPRTRGSTQDDSRLDPLVQVSPAYAGIDLY